MRHALRILPSDPIFQIVRYRKGYSPVDDFSDLGPEERDRAPNGRFDKGTSGNPRGRPAGSRNKATLAAEAMLEGEAEELTRKVLDLAREGDMTALKLCLDRILPARRERLLEFELPPLSSACDAPKAIAAITKAVAQGEITLSEATGMGKLVEVFVAAIEASDFEERLKMLEDTANMKVSTTPTGSPRSRKKPPW